MEASLKKVFEYRSDECYHKRMIVHKQGGRNGTNQRMEGLQRQAA